MWQAKEARHKKKPDYIPRELSLRTGKIKHSVRNRKVLASCREGIDWKGQAAALGTWEK